MTEKYKAYVDEMSIFNKEGELAVTLTVADTGVVTIELHDKNHNAESWAELAAAVGETAEFMLKIEAKNDAAE